MTVRGRAAASPSPMATAGRRPGCCACPQAARQARASALAEALARISTCHGAWQSRGCRGPAQPRRRNVSRPAGLWISAARGLAHTGRASRQRLSPRLGLFSSVAAAGPSGKCPGQEPCAGFSASPTPPRSWARKKNTTVPWRMPGRGDLKLWRARGPRRLRRAFRSVGRFPTRNTPEARTAHCVRFGPPFRTHARRWEASLVKAWTVNGAPPHPALVCDPAAVGRLSRLPSKQSQDSPNPSPRPLARVCPHCVLLAMHTREQTPSQMADANPPTEEQREMARAGLGGAAAEGAVAALLYKNEEKRQREDVMDQQVGRLPFKNTQAVENVAGRSPVGLIDEPY